MLRIPAYLVLSMQSAQICFSCYESPVFAICVVYRKYETRAVSENAREGTNM